MITREQYMKDHTLHHAYYLEVAHEAGIDYSKSSKLQRCIDALATGDEHLNTIPLREWDKAAAFTEDGIRRALKKRGDNYSMAGGVCVHKCAAIEAAKR